jgi:crossover junction endodeoxyribonuclease RuvC
VGIRPQQFEELQARTRAARRSPTPAFDPPTAPPRPRHLTVLGIDPSLRGTGWGVLRQQPGGPVALAYGTIPCPAALPRSRCLVRIADQLRDAIRQYQPTTCAIEGLFFAQNLQTALIMGEARGVCLLAAAEAGLDITEIAPRRVKQAIVGFGGARKLAVARMIQRLLHLPEAPPDDAADALALALALVQTSTASSLQPKRHL